MQEAIERLMLSRTTILVAHRLSTVRDADTICVVSKGRIVERGGHEELLGLAGVYKQLVSRQMSSKGAGGSPSRGGSSRNGSAHNPQPVYPPQPVEADRAGNVPEPDVPMGTPVS